MDKHKTRSELKQEAKDLLNGNWKTAILLNIIPTLLIIVFFTFFLFIFSFSAIFTSSNVTNSGVGNSYMSILHTQGGGNSTGGVLNTASGIITGLFFIGISFTFLDWLRNPAKEIHPLKDATQVFSKRYFVPILGTEVLIYVFTFLWGLLLVIPGIIKGIAYSQTYFIYKDLEQSGKAKDMKLTNFITESRHLMKGNKWRYFVLQLSFIGWHILCILSFGIGYLWLNPYLNATLAAFYKDLSDGRYLTE